MYFVINDEYKMSNQSMLGEYGPWRRMMKCEHDMQFCIDEIA